MDKDIKHLEMKLKAILTEWEQAKADIKTRLLHPSFISTAATIIKYEIYENESINITHLTVLKNI